MNRERFTELLNLYLDDEISSAELSDLMNETRRRPDRQKLFLDYCRIHKACSLIGDSYEAGKSKRSFKQVAYALGGLAAAFALLGMAGRNLLPLLNGPTSNPAIVQNSSAEGNTLFFPEIDTSDTFKTRFFKVNEQPNVEYVGVSNFGNIQTERHSSLKERLILNQSEKGFGLKAESFLSEEALDLGELDLEDPFNDFFFDEMSTAAPMSFSKAAYLPAGNAFGVSIARDGRPHLK